jgi:nucleoid DNA-binding protein
MTAPAQSQKAASKGTLASRLAAVGKIKEDQVNAILMELGNVIRDKIAAGEAVELPNLGTIQVVRIPEHRDLVDGRPALIPANNYVTFLPVAGLVAASNAANAIPSSTVPPFEFNPLPGQSPSGRVGNTRQPNSRIR